MSEQNASDPAEAPATLVDPSGEYRPEDDAFDSFFAPPPTDEQLLAMSRERADEILPPEQHDRWLLLHGRAVPAPLTTEEEDQSVVDGVTEWTTLGVLMADGKLPSGRAVSLRQMLAEDDAWVGKQADTRGMTEWGVLRAAVGWWIESLDGVPLVRNERVEMRAPQKISQDRLAREALVDSLTYGDVAAVLVMLAADEDPDCEVDCRCEACEHEFKTLFDLRDLPTRRRVPGCKVEDLEFEFAGMRWGPVSSSAWKALDTKAVYHEMRVSAYRGGLPLNSLRKRAANKLMDEIDRRTCMPRWAVSAFCPQCKTPWEGALSPKTFLSLA